jgi:hypothetical protein
MARGLLATAGATVRADTDLQGTTKAPRLAAVG